MNWQLVQDLIGWDSTLESLSTGEAVIKKNYDKMELSKLILGQFGSNETAIMTCLCLIYSYNSFFSFHLLSLLFPTPKNECTAEIGSTLPQSTM